MRVSFEAFLQTMNLVSLRDITLNKRVLSFDELTNTTLGLIDLAYEKYAAIEEKEKEEYNKRVGVTK